AGLRVFHVTGVQTCPLPLSPPAAPPPPPAAPPPPPVPPASPPPPPGPPGAQPSGPGSPFGTGTVPPAGDWVRGTASVPGERPGKIGRASCRGGADVVALAVA